MDFNELLISAVEALTLNKLRTALATLGIIIGIGSVIALVSLGQSSQQQVSASIESLGANLLTILPGAQTTGGISAGAGSSETLTYEDATALSTSPQITDVRAVSPEVSRRAQVSAAGTNTNLSVIGATDAYMTVHNVTMSEGVFISAQENQALAKVAVIGPQVVSDLFNGADPLGQTIRINKLAFRIIGITASKGGSGFQNPDDTIYIPLQTAQKQVFGQDYLSDIAIAAKSQDVMTDAENQVGYLLLARHKLSDPTKADFSILSQSDILGAASSVTGTFTALLSGIAAISLLVGGIGIMNIMLVTVTERTREIGLRKALGAHNNTIVSQFLVEAVILTFAGGFFGMLLGIAVSFTISTLIKLPFVLSVGSIVLAISVSGGIGILFGWYPARKAAGLSPIEALRYE
ncbi:MAG TPA: ABC transporter permease [Patescibacteria group bacterium]|nr:ABC transporter permease [Patescibacteria group bacterium]